MEDNGPRKYNKRYTDKLEESFDDILLDTSEEPVEHVDEKWLVSYADMMTLLFGLFVMLYAIAMETQGKPDKFLAEMLASKNTLSEFEIQIQAKEKELVALKQELDDVTLQLSDKTHKLKGAMAESDKFKGLITQLQGKLQQVQKQQGNHMPSGKELEAIKETALLKQSKVGLEKIKSGLEQSLLELNLKLKGFKDQVQVLMAENQSLNNQLKEFNDGQGTDNFMIIVLKWETEKHDLDLTVTDPSGRIYNFDNRNYKESAAKFVIDSRSGPGVEMWETPHIEAGDYKIEFNFYNSYGNIEKAKVSGTIITRKGEFSVPNVQMDMEKNKKKSFKIQTTKAGSVIIQSLP